MLAVICDECKSQVDTNDNVFCQNCIDKLENKLEEMKEAYDALKADLETAEEKITELEGELGEAQERIQQREG